MLNNINVIHANNDIVALILLLPVELCITKLIGGINNNVIPIPNKPLSNPMINVSALNIDEILCNLFYLSQ